MLVMPRLFFMFTDPDHRSFFVEEKASGYTARSIDLFHTLDSGGGRYQPAVYMPAAAMIALVSFKTVDFGIWQFRLPFVVFAAAGLFLLGIVLIRLCGDAVGFLALAGFGTAPLLISLNSTAVNENLYFFIMALLLFSLSKMDDQERQAKTDLTVPVTAFLAGLISVLAVMTKIDAAVLAIAVGTTVLFGNVGKNNRMKIFKFCALGCIAGLALFAAFMFLVPGLERTLDSYEFINEIFVKQKTKSFTVSQLIARLFVTVPKYLHSLLPGFLLFGVAGLLLLPFLWRKQKLPVQFSLLFLFISMPLLIKSPLLYWKRFIVILLPFVLVAVSFVDQLKNIDFQRPRLRWGVAAALGIGVAANLVAVLSDFGPSWKVQSPWAKRENAAIFVGLIILVPLMAAGLVGYIRKPQKLIQGLFIASCGAVIISGIASIASHEWRYEGDRIGKAIAARIGNGRVVADEQAFRYFAYYSDAPVLFMHENDPLYPKGVFELIARNKPEYIVASDAYYPFPGEIGKNVKGYEFVESFQYLNPKLYFEQHQKTQTISIFRRIKA